LAVWAFILPFTQPEQQLRSRVEHNFVRGQLGEAFAEMSARSPSDFPPHWDPPPNVGFIRHGPDFLTVMECMLDHPPAPWVRERYLCKFQTFVYLHDDVFASYRWGGDPQEDEKRILRIVLRMPEGRGVVRREPRLFKHLLERGKLPTEERTGLQALLEQTE